MKLSEIWADVSVSKCNKFQLDTALYMAVFGFLN